MIILLLILLLVLLVLLLLLLLLILQLLVLLLRGSEQPRAKILSAGLKRSSTYDLTGRKF